MKKILLFIFVLGIGVSVMAQQTYQFKMDPDHRTIYEKMVVDVEPLKETPITSTRVEQNIAPSDQRGVNSISIIDIGTSANAWTYNSNNVGNQKSIVWAEPELNIVTNFHRDGGVLNPDAFSGDYTYDISFDGGMTWTNNIKCYRAVNNNGGSDGDAARYPSHGIYNPTGDVEDAYVAFFGPNLDGTNSNTPGAGWGGYSFGVANISDPTDTTGNYNRKSSHDDTYQYIPDAFDVNSLGRATVVDNNVNWTSGTGVYEGSLTVNQGVWDDDEMDIVYEEELFDYESDLVYGSPWFTQVAYAPDGMTGYIAILGNDGETWNTDDARHSVYPIFWKTTDGGESWDGPTAIQIDGPDGIGGIVDHLLTDEQIAEVYTAPVPERDEIPYTYTGDFEIGVSANGNLYIAGIICAAGEAETDGGISFVIREQFGAQMLLFTSDGGTTWFAEEMGRIFQYDGTWGDMKEGNRTQISMNPGADRVFVSWLDNDKDDEPDNSNPNIYARGFDPMTYAKTGFYNDDEELVDGPTNVTYFSLAWNQALFGTVAKTALELVEGEYTLPYTYGQLTDGDPGAPAQWKYIPDFVFTEADFLITGIGDDIEAQENNATVSQNYPNPFSGQTFVTVNLSEGADLSLEVYSLTGQMVSLNQYGFTPQGSSTLTIDGSDLVPGVYFYTITAGENKVTQKMIVE